MGCPSGNVFSFSVCVNVFMIKHEGEARRKWWRENVSQIAAFRDWSPAGATPRSVCVCVRWCKASAVGCSLSRASVPAVGKEGRWDVWGVCPTCFCSPQGHNVPELVSTHLP